MLESCISYLRSGKDRCGIYKTRCVEYILKDCIRNVWVDLVVVRDPMGSKGALDSGEADVKANSVAIEDALERKQGDPITKHHKATIQ